MATKAVSWAGWYVAAALLALTVTRSLEPKRPARHLLEPAPPTAVLTMNADEVPLRSFVRDLSRQMPNSVTSLAEEKLASHGINEGTPITLHCDREPVAAALARVTSNGKPLPLGMYESSLDGGNLVAPLAIAQASAVSTRFYDTAPARIALAHHWAAMPDDTEIIAPRLGFWQLPQVIQRVVAPSSWAENGGRTGSILELGSLLVITQTAENHTRIRGLLDAMAAGHFEGSH